MTVTSSRLQAEGQSLDLSPDPSHTEARPPRRGAPAWVGLIGYGIVLAEIVLFASLAPTFLSTGNLLNILTQASVYAVAAFGVTIVVIVGGDHVARGGIDLSSGAVLGFVGALTAFLLRDGFGIIPALFLGLGAAAIIGLINGYSVVAGVRPLLVTLATMTATLSATIALTGNVKIDVTHSVIFWLRDGIGGISGSVIVLVAVFSILLIVSRGRWGAQAYAVGQNPTAARIAGLNTHRYVLVSYVLSAVLAGIAGVLMTSRLTAALPAIGEQALISILLATFMSIAFSRRLVVTLSGTLFATIFVAVLDSGFIALGVPSQWVGVTKGILILVVLAVAAVRERKVAR